jgi:hypothetical protein
MTHVMTMAIDDGSTVLVEVADDTGIERVGRVDTVVRDASETLNEALARVRPAAASILRSVREMAQPPDTVTLEFGVKLTAEAGVVVARTTGEANFKITVEWSTDSNTAAGSTPSEATEPGLS